ncbi:tripartite tricarboxylate transporter substrate binding protein [Ramlibacter alkalitolerans]|nr:tripartite tricarboxylate transporter substrate binding protein [Ramlibacter alkalitolerans]
MRHLLATLIGVLPLVTGVPAAAQGEFPNKPLRVIVPFPAGGVVDALARVVGDKLSARYGQPVIVESKAGAGGAIGTEFVAKAPADGYTLLMVSPSHAVAPAVQKGLNWDPVRDFRGIAGFGIIPNVIVVHPSVPAHSMVEFIELARKARDPLTYATSGVGTSSHLAGELLAQSANIKLTAVPYKGQPDAVSDLLSGRVNMMPMSVSLALPHIKAGKLRALAVTTSERSSAMPEVPTVADAAKLQGFGVGTWLALLAPAKVPDAVAAKLSVDVAAILAMPDVQSRIQTMGFDLHPQSGVQFDAFLKTEVTKWARVVKQAGIQPN